VSAVCQCLALVLSVRGMPDDVAARIKVAVRSPVSGRPSRERGPSLLGILVSALDSGERVGPERLKELCTSGGFDMESTGLYKRHGEASYRRAMSNLLFQLKGDAAIKRDGLYGVRVVSAK
jgi:hypothetical protein